MPESEEKLEFSSFDIEQEFYGFDCDDIEYVHKSAKISSLGGALPKGDFSGEKFLESDLYKEMIAATEIYD